MKEYLLTLILITALGSSLLCLIHNKGYARYLSYLFCLVALIFLVSPLKALLGKQTPLPFTAAAPEETRDDGAYARELTARLKGEIEKQLEAEIFSSLALGEEDVSVECRLYCRDFTIGFEEIICRLKSVDAILHREELRALLARCADKIVFTEER